MCVCVCVHMCACFCVWVYMYLCMSLWMWVYTCLCMFMHVYMHVCACAFMSMCAHVYRQKLLVHLPATQTRVITQTLYSLQHYLANEYSVFLASAYILSQPISINLCISTRLWPTGKVLASVSFKSCMASLWLCLLSLSICLDFLPDFSLLSYWPKQLL